MTRRWTDKDPGRGSDASRRHPGPAADAPPSRVFWPNGWWDAATAGLFVAYTIFVVLAIASLFSCAGANGYHRAEYFNSDDVFQYAQVMSGTRYALTERLDIDLGVGEYFDLDGTDPREVITAGVTFDYGRLSIHTSADVIGPWESKPEFSVYGAIELSY